MPPNESRLSCAAPNTQATDDSGRVNADERSNERLQFRRRQLQELVRNAALTPILELPQSPQGRRWLAISQPATEPFATGVLSVHHHNTNRTIPTLVAAA